MADALFQEPTECPTIKAALKALERAQGKRSHSARVGGSSVGDECLRKGWYSFRWASPIFIGANGLLAIADGHRGEIVIADLLKAVDSIELWTEDPENPGKQISFTLVDGHFIGKLDGIILGLVQAPKTPHVWEAKVVNEKKLNALKKAIEKYGEKNALEQWDEKYFAQGQMYMRGMNIERHYLTVASPGVREIISVRTEYQPKMAEKFEERAKRIAFEVRIPSRISTDPAFFKCKFCDHHDMCHGSRLPQINCRTCTHSTAIAGGKWHCAKFDVELDYDAQQAACKHHRFHPDMINGTVLIVNDADEVAYSLADGTGFRDGEKVDRPPAPMVKVAKAEPAPPYLHCTACGLIYSEMPKDHPQCVECSGAIVEVPF